MKKTILFLTVLCLAMTCILPAAVLAEQTGRVRGGWLRLRTAPSLSGQIIGSYYTGTQVTIHSTTGSWYYVTAPDGRTGYMSRNFITVGGSSAPAPTGSGWTGVPSGQSGYVTSQNGLGVRLRSTPAKVSGNIIGKYAVGTPLVVNMLGSTWHYITIGGQTGYMMAEFIILGGSPKPQPDPGIHPIPVSPYTAYVTSQNGKSVRMRVGPGTGYGTITSFPVGTAVTVTGYYGSWSYITVGSLSGYMMSSFLTTGGYPGPTPVPGPQPSKGTLQSAEITIADPIVGDRLHVLCNPMDADVSILWFNEQDIMLGSGNDYLVKKTDNGHSIYARVTGRNQWSGSCVTMATEPVGGKGVIPPTPKTLSGILALPAVMTTGSTVYPSITNCNAPGSALKFSWSVGAVPVASGSSLYITNEMAGSQLYLMVTADGYEGSLHASGYIQAAAPSPTQTPVPTEPPATPKPVEPIEVITPKPVEPVEVITPKPVEPVEVITPKPVEPVELITPKPAEPTQTDSLVELITPRPAGDRIQTAPSKGIKTSRS